MSLLEIHDWYAWAPGLDSSEKWLDWAERSTTSELGDVPESAATVPSLSHLPPISRRRLSQLSKMVLEVGHQVLQDKGSMKLIFCSRFGEIVQQNRITKRLIEEGDVRPASFSLSVFNTPVSLLSIHENIKESISVLLSGDHCLMSGFASLIAQLKKNREEPCLIVFADEALPEEYEELTNLNGKAYAFAFVVSLAEESSTGLSFSFSSSGDSGNEADHPLDILRWYLRKAENDFIIRQDCIRLKLSSQCCGNPS